MAVYLTTEFCRDLLKLCNPAYAEKLFMLGPVSQPFFSVNAYLLFVILDEESAATIVKKEGEEVFTNPEEINLSDYLI